MRFIIQRVSNSKVTIDNEIRGQIGKGFMVLIGVGESDTKEIADKMIHKMINLRIFEDDKLRFKGCGWQPAAYIAVYIVC